MKIYQRFLAVLLMTQMMVGPAFAAEAGLSGATCREKLSQVTPILTEQIPGKVTKQSQAFTMQAMQAAGAGDSANETIFRDLATDCRQANVDSQPDFDAALAAHDKACSLADQADRDNVAALAAAQKATGAMTGKADAKAQAQASSLQRQTHSKAAASLGLALGQMKEYEAAKSKGLNKIHVKCPQVASEVQAEEERALQLANETNEKLSGDKLATESEGISTGTAIAGGLAIAGLAGLAGYAIGGGFKGDKDKGGGGGSSPSTPVTSTPTTPTPPPALTGPGETPEGSQNLTASDTQRTLANAGTPQNLTPVTPGADENQGAQGRSGSALSSGASGSGAGSGAGSGGGASYAGAQGRMANARSASTGGGGSGFSPSSFGGGGGGDGKELKDGAAVGYAAGLKGCQKEIPVEIFDPKRKKRITVMKLNPNYKKCQPIEAKSKVRTPPAATKRAAAIKKDALLN
jgi:hypothetical protein